jgi:hypothetical protein
VRASPRSRELRLPTQIVPVRLAIIGGAPTAAEMFVADVPRRSRGQLLDDLAALLVTDATFVPVRWSSRVRLLAKHAISWVAVARRDPDELVIADAPGDPLDDLTLYDRQHLVEIELVHATKLLGTLLDSSPSDRPRVVDHLNRAGRFLRLWTTDEHYLINTSQVVAVTELGEAPGTAEVPGVPGAPGVPGVQ